MIAAFRLKASPIHLLKRRTAKQFSLRRFSHGNSVDGLKIARRGPGGRNNFIPDENAGSYKEDNNSRNEIFLHGWSARGPVRRNSRMQGWKILAMLG